MKNLDEKIKVLNENRGENSELQRIDDLFEKYIIVKLNDGGGTLKMTHRENFADCHFCECYGDYGVKVGCFGAGCYSLDNSDSSIHSDLLLAIEKDFDVKIFDYFGNRHGMTFCSVDEFLSLVIELNNETDVHDEFNYSPVEIEKIELFVRNWVKENEHHTEVKAWTFHDSHNFNSIVIDYKDLDREPDCSELDQDEQRKILAEYTGVPNIEGATATEETNNYYFSFTRYASDNWICEIVKK